MLQNIPPYFIRGRGESEPSRESREERSSSGELLISDMALSSGPMMLSSDGKEVAGRRRSRDGWRPGAMRQETREIGRRPKGGQGGGNQELRLKGADWK